jgi:3-phosphoshikimate 1-carboxyvinyltransferase
VAASIEDTRSFHESHGLTGTIQVPGDKSITHRAILFGLLASGETTIDGWLNAADCNSSLHVAKLLGAKATVSENRITLHGTAGSLSEPEDILDCGNSGTTMRIFSGVLAPLVPFACVTGDASLRKRPMERVIAPLREMGANIVARGGKYAPFSVQKSRLTGIEYTLPVSSAQVKSAILLAGCFAAAKKTVVIEQTASRDHTENMLGAFGVEIDRTPLSKTGNMIEIQPGQSLKAAHVTVPGDISSAAFLICAAAIVPDSDVLIQNIGLNPGRTGLLKVLSRMNAIVEIVREESVAGERIGDIRIQSSALTGTEIEPAEVPSLVDELPILAVTACMAKGDTVIRGAKELRFKETDRIHAMAKGLLDIGCDVTELDDGLVIHGREMILGGTVDSFHDHRIAMSFAVAGLVAKSGVQVQNWSCVQISFPSFLETLQELM